MGTYTSRYNEWLSSPYFDDQTKDELASIQSSLKEIEERFCKDLVFGTGGLRAIIGAGTNRLNKYTVRRITQGYASFLLKNYGNQAKEKGVVIAYDTRYLSDVFSREIAQTLAFNGIKAYLFKKVTTTPELSFAVPYLNAIGGIVVTASHNPPSYNGYKIYDESGCQAVPKLAEKIINEIEQITDYSKIGIADLDDALIEWLDESVDTAFIEAEKRLVRFPELIKRMGEQFQILYTPLHGTGKYAIFRLLKEVGFKKIYTVEEQLEEDVKFSTVDSPNPEEQSAFEMSINVGKKHDVDLIMGTDPDCDRVGVLVKIASGHYKALNGNQIGALLVYYLLSTDEKLSNKKNPFIAKTIVTSELGTKIAEKFSVETINTLTGFKYIGEKINVKTPDASFITGYEESYGYLVGEIARDKDGVGSTLVIAEMAAYYANEGLTLYDVLVNLYKEFGYYKEKQLSIHLTGQAGLAKTQQLMSQFRHLTERFKIENDVKGILDYSTGIDGLPQADVIKILFKDESWIAVRPSGTEPKIKFYLGVVGVSEKESNEKLNILEEIIGKVGK
ncbi:phospho-sugar mutase [Enterococcus sp. AZ192]|uniref:phospho-sugar mutase n=1 Tax=unclassified Enterococcus TaxID=2608891 RepID=UPI003D2A8610